tara:strand:- start:764 stop:1150 length:387 start_codon:yes stop_codon:yes gene_type:complete
MGFRDRFKEEMKRIEEEQKKKKKQQQEEAKKQQEEAKKQQEQQAVEQQVLLKKISKIKLTVGDIKKDYEIEKTVFSIQQTGYAENAVGSMSINAFTMSEENLKMEACKLNCDAVINVRFEVNTLSKFI